MKRKLFALLLALCMLLTACGQQPDNSPAENGQTQTNQGQEEQTAPPDDGFSTSVSGRVEDPEGLVTETQKQLMTRLLTDWYTDIALFDEPQLTALFSDEEDAAMHQASIRTLNAIRARALIDLRMKDVDYVLTVTKAEPSTEEDAVEGQIHIEADESAVMHFAATPEVDSKLYDVPHIFELVPEGDGWLIKHHEADDNPYFSLTYQEGKEEDGQLQQLLRAIERRQLQRQETVQVTLTCDHPYDRAAAEQYMRQYDHQRSSAWHAYDDVGGNCMNFGSQVLLAGGIPMDEQGGSKWYWYGQNSLDLSWINVGRFYSYARENEGYGLVADTEANYYTGEVGDILILGPDGGHNHTTVISGIIRDEAGQTVDYLLCSNTTNYTDFPQARIITPASGSLKFTGGTKAPLTGRSEELRCAADGGMDRIVGAHHPKSPLCKGRWQLRRHSRRDRG